MANKVKLGTDNKPKVVNEDPTKQAFVNILEFITNTFYKTDENEIVSVEISKENIGANFYDTKRIVVSDQLLDAFGELDLPRFLIYYHELGHHVYSQGMFLLKQKWLRLGAGDPLEFHEKYANIENWIEDYYVERAMITEYPYLTDVIRCIKKLPPDYDILNIEYAFNFYYVNEVPSSTLAYVDQVTFKTYVDDLLAMRSNSNTRFGKGVLSTLSVHKSIETKYITKLIEFYDWCEQVGIFDPANPPQPPLQNPNNHNQAQTGNSSGNKGNNNSGNNGSKGKGKGKGSSDHSKTVGKITGYKETTHISSPTTIFKDQVKEENRQINKELLDMSQRLQVENHTLDGLFSTKHKDSAIIQPKIILLNFFNPHRLIDQVLFKQKQHTYTNVAIYRDISSSTYGDIHTLMEHVTAKFFEEIPVEIKYYLYSSGRVSIVEVPYIPWLTSSKVPKFYKQNPIYKQMTGGTNSDAIADAITDQLSEKWLNIIITDGDLNRLMARDNISSLLENVFIVSVGQPVEPGLLGVEVKSVNDIPSIIGKLSTINAHKLT